jgi:hypothetical protein
LTDVDVAAIEALVDVTTCVMKISKEQINALVKSGGDPEVAATIFSLGTNTSAPQSTSEAQKPADVVPTKIPEPKEITADDVEGMDPETFLRSFANEG